MKKILFIACAALLLLTSCIFGGKEDRTFILDNPKIDKINESYEIADITLPAYLCSSEMRYTTEDGELHTIAKYKWALPLDRLLKATANDTLRTLPKSTLNPKHTFRIDRVCLTSKKTLLFTGEVSISDDANPRKPQPVPFTCNVKITDETLTALAYRNAMTRVLGELLQIGL